jgi:SpoVK/Ycf46/Vps4 family AAA+-type ATPase
MNIRCLGNTELTFDYYNADLSQTQKFNDDFCKFILETAPQEIIDKIELLKDFNCPERLRPHKILLYGPSGSGKTTLAQVIAQEINRSFVVINAGLLGNEYKNSAVQNLRRSIEPYLTIPSVIIIDEIDCIVKQSKNEKDPDQETPKQVWEMIDVCAQFPNVLLIAISNDIKGMPEPLQTRFAGDTIEVPLADSGEIRKQTIFFHLRDAVYWENDCYFDHLASKTSNFSFRELEKLVNNAMAISYLRKCAPCMVTKDDFEVAYRNMVKSRTMLGKWSWSDYEKPLQYGLQIAGLAISITSLITSLRSSWLSQIISEETLKHQKDTSRESINLQKDSIELQKKSYQQAEDLAKKNINSSEKIAQSSNQVARENMQASVQIANAQARNQGPGIMDAINWGITTAQNQPKSLHELAARKGY